MRAQSRCPADQRLEIVDHTSDYDTDFSVSLQSLMTTTPQRHYVRMPLFGRVIRNLILYLCPSCHRAVKDRTIEEHESVEGPFTTVYSKNRTVEEEVALYRSEHSEQ